MLPHQSIETCWWSSITTLTLPRAWWNESSNNGNSSGIRWTSVDKQHYQERRPLSSRTLALWNPFESALCLARPRHTCLTPVVPNYGIIVQLLLCGGISIIIIIIVFSIVSHCSERVHVNINDRQWINKFQLALIGARSAAQLADWALCLCLLSLNARYK